MSHRWEPPAAHDQASRLRALVSGERESASIDPARPPAGPRGPVIAITSGKGGVGKSSLGVNLCIALAGRGVRAAMIDADLGMANADVLCGLTPARRIEHAVESVGEIDLEALAVPGPGGFRLVPGSTGIARIADIGEHDLARLVRASRRLACGHGAVLVDTGAGLGPSVVALASAADVALVVATPEPTSIADAYAMVKCLHRGGGIGVISLWINRATSEREAHAVCERISSVAERFLGFRPLFAGWVPEDAAVGRAVRSRVPFVIAESKSAASRSVFEMAERVESSFLCADRAEMRASRSLFGALRSWWEGDTHAGQPASAQVSTRGSRGFSSSDARITEFGRYASR